MAAGICVLLLVADRLLLTPLLTRWRTKQDQIATLRLSIGQDQALLDQEARWHRWEAEARVRRLAGVRSEAESALIGAVDDWARGAGLTLTSIRPRWHEATGGDGRGPVQRARLELQLGGEGSVNAVTRFLYAAETAPMALAIERVDLSSASPDGQRLSLDLRVSGLLGDATSGAGGAHREVGP